MLMTTKKKKKKTHCVRIPTPRTLHGFARHVLQGKSLATVVVAVVAGALACSRVELLCKVLKQQDTTALDRLFTVRNLRWCGGQVDRAV